jgi:hypothetical protein
MKKFPYQYASLAPVALIAQKEFKLSGNTCHKINLTLISLTPFLAEMIQGRTERRWRGNDEVSERT